jgi:hypothetical protein
MKTIFYQEAELILNTRLDRRMKCFHEDTQDAFQTFGGGPIYTYGEWTQECSGCTESYMGQYYTGQPGKGIGCSECGYTGKRRQGWWAPVCVKAKERPNLPLIVPSV